MKEKTEGLVFDVTDIIKRCKTLRGIKTDSAMAELLGISRSTLCNWMARNSMDFPLVLNAFADVNFNWLLTGKGQPFEQPGFCEDRLAEGQVELVGSRKSPEPLEDRMVPLYDINAAANLKSILEDRAQYVMGDILIPGVPRCDGALFVAGDSMYPILKAGDIVGFKMLHTIEPALLHYGEMYLISFNLDDDEQLVVKYLARSEQEGCIKLVSYNEHHCPIDLPLKYVRSMALVKFSIRKHTIM